MTTLKRAEDVAAELKRRIALCTIALGAETDIGNKVFQGRRHVDDSMIPCATIIEADDTPDRVNVSTQYEIAQRFVIFAYVPCDPNDPNVGAHKAIRDLKRAVFLTNGQEDTKWGRTVREVRYLGRDIGPRADGASFVIGAIEIMVSWVENMAAP